MAMRDQWTDFHGPSSSLMGPTMTRPSSSLADSTAVTTTSGTSFVGNASSPNSHTGIEGRIGKSVKRRSRASRRAPVTLLNTDTSNFRAMVQQFTGIPSGPYSSGNLPGTGGPGLNFGLDFNVPMRPSQGVMSFDQIQRPQFQRPPFHEQSYSSQRQQQYEYGTGGNLYPQGEFHNNDGNNNDNNDIFGQGFINDGIFADAMAGRMISKTNSAANNRNHDGYYR